jgi:hypothetical protein
VARGFEAGEEGERAVERRGQRRRRRHAGSLRRGGTAGRGLECRRSWRGVPCFEVQANVF